MEVDTWMSAAHFPGIAGSLTAGPASQFFAPAKGRAADFFFPEKVLVIQ